MKLHPKKKNERKVLKLKARTNLPPPIRFAVKIKFWINSTSQVRAEEVVKELYGHHCTITNIAVEKDTKSENAKKRKSVAAHESAKRWLKERKGLHLS